MRKLKNILKSIFVKEKEELPNDPVMECFNIYKNLNIFNYELFKTTFIQVSVIFKNIDLYIKNIRRYNKSLSNNTIIRLQDDELNLLLVNLDSFFVTQDGFYIDVQTSVEELKSAIIELCENLLDNDDDENFLHLNNKKVLSFLIHNLIELSKTLNQNQP